MLLILISIYIYVTIIGIEEEIMNLRSQEDMEVIENGKGRVEMM